MAKQYSVKREKHWEISFWLIFDAWGAVRLTRGQPDCNRGERAMSVTVNVPYALFNVPSLKATMTIDTPEPLIPPIDLSAASEALKKVIGFDVDIKVNPVEQPE